MNLTLHTRHALRVLAHLASEPARLSSIWEIARVHGMSHNHLMKVVHGLRQAGFVDAVRGRSGGIRLARPAREITLGDVVRYTEAPPPVPATGSDEDGILHDVFQQAFGSFFASLDGNRLSDVADIERAGAAPEDAAAVR